MSESTSAAYMSTPPPAKPDPPRRSSHITLRPAGEGADIREIFEDQVTSRTRVLSGTVVHVIAVALLLLIAKLIPDQVYETILPDRLPKDLVWLVQPGPGGGGGGGNKNPEPPKPAELKGQEKINVPAVKPPEPKPVELEKVPDTPPEPLLSIPVQTMAAANAVSPGDISSASTSSASRGSGTGTGIGPGEGSGLGPGRGGGFGGGVYDVGSGVTPPRLLKKVDPKYTADAMRAKIQGIVEMSAVVLPDGTVTDLSVIKSLDSSFGLDEEAKKAAAQWRFSPGTRLGEPVATRIRIELEFHLR